MNFVLKEEQNFLTQDEIDFLRHEVYNSEKYWKHVSQTPIGFEEHRARYPQEVVKHFEDMLANQYFLGDAIYVMDNKLDHIDTATQEYMKQRFSWLYDKTIAYFKKLYKTENVILHETLPIPGFHIFSNKSEIETNTKHFEWHNDTSVQEYVDNVKDTSIYSFVVLVENIEDLSHLDIKANGVETVVNYEYGTLHMWSGLLTHKIGSMKLKPKESRITFQGHLYYDIKDGFYKLYF
jgi:hypothetical protein